MVIGIYNPYHDTLGGGEQYVFTFAQYFLEKKHTVIYFSSDPQEIIKAQLRFDIDLSGMVLQPPVFETGSLLEKIQTTNKLDMLLFYSDGSIPVSFAKKTVLIFQFPVPWVNGSTFITQLKKSRVAEVIVNSQFTKQFIDKTYSVNAHILHPAINTRQYVVKTKQKFILTVGRFTKKMNTKRHDILIQTFKSMIDKGLKDWKLVIAGGVRVEDIDMLEHLNEDVKEYPIEILANIEHKKLLQLYSEAPIYWHASGYDVDETSHPEQVEHFGISTVEAMASGAVPIVYPAGGQREIVTDEKNGKWWKTPEQLAVVTSELIEHPEKREELSMVALEKVKDYDQSVFYETLIHILPR